MQSLARNNFTAEQVKKALHSANRKISFRYELLDKNNNFKKHLVNVLDASISNDSLATIKRIANIKISEDKDINFLSDRIKPYCRIWIPAGRKYTTVKVIPGDNYFLLPFFPVQYNEGEVIVTKQEEPLEGGWAEWPLGVFLLSTPPRKADIFGVVTRDIEAYDQLQVLVDDKVETRYTIIAGTNYIAAVKTVLDSAGITTQNLTSTTLILPAAREWEPGTKKLTIVNDLLGAINYRSLYFDESGFAVAQPYTSPTDHTSEYTYKDDNQSVIFPEVEQGLDLFAIPNKWRLTVSEADREPLVSVYVNNNPDSQTSIVGRGREIMADPEMVEAADQSILDALVQRRAFEASQIYEHVTFETAIMPHHSEADVFTLEFSGLLISAKYSETSWSMDLKAGAKMHHSVRRIVSI